MPPSRRRVLYLAGLSATGLGGCLGNAGTPTPGDTPTRSTPTDTPPPTTDVRTDASTDAPTSEPTDSPDVEAATGCDDGPPPSGWPLPDRSTGRTNHHADADGPTETPDVRWRVTAAEPERGEVRYTRPVVADGTVYVGREVVVGTNQRRPDTHHVRAFDAACGDPLWRAPVSGGPSVPLVVEGTVVVHDGTTLYALDAATGDRRWTHGPTDGVAGVVPTDGGVLLASSGDGSQDEVRALSLDGGVDWRLSVPASVGSDLARVADRAYFVTNDGVLVAVDTSEQAVAWTLDLQDGEDTVPASVTATPAAVFPVVDGVVYAVTPDGDLSWSNEAEVRNVATDGDTVYGVGGDGYVHALSAADGTRRWRRFQGEHDHRYVDGFYDDPALGDETLYAGTLDGTLQAMASADGRTRWRVARDWPGDAAVALAERALYVAWGNRLVALR